MAYFSLLQTQILRNGFSDAIKTLTQLRQDLERFGVLNRKFEDIAKGDHPIFQTLLWLENALAGNPITEDGTPENILEMLKAQLGKIRTGNA
ncbi:hypothetical protein EXS74_02565 [Candidatus Woesearchaeota archaeon]|nr:hypothetical protein [Candidatus Woesearchaeota archaeon]